MESRGIDPRGTGGNGAGKTTDIRGDGGGSGNNQAAVHITHKFDPSRPELSPYSAPHIGSPMDPVDIEVFKAISNPRRTDFELPRAVPRDAAIISRSVIRGQALMKNDVSGKGTANGNGPAIREPSSLSHSAPTMGQNSPRNGNGGRPAFHGASIEAQAEVARLDKIEAEKRVLMARNRQQQQQQQSLAQSNPSAGSNHNTNAWRNQHGTSEPTVYQVQQKQSDRFSSGFIPPPPPPALHPFAGTDNNSNDNNNNNHNNNEWDTPAQSPHTIPSFASSSSTSTSTVLANHNQEQQQQPPRFLSPQSQNANGDTSHSGVTLTPSQNLPRIVERLPDTPMAVLQSPLPNGTVPPSPYVVMPSAQPGVSDAEREAKKKRAWLIQVYKLKAKGCEFVPGIEDMCSDDIQFEFEKVRETYLTRGGVDTIKGWLRNPPMIMTMVSEGLLSEYVDLTGGGHGNDDSDDEVYDEENDQGDGYGATGSSGRRRRRSGQTHGKNLCDEWEKVIIANDDSIEAISKRYFPSPASNGGKGGSGVGGNPFARLAMGFGTALFQTVATNSGPNLLALLVQKSNERAFAGRGQNHNRHNSSYNNNNNNNNRGSSRNGADRGGGFGGGVRSFFSRFRRTEQRQEQAQQQPEHYQQVPSAYQGMDQAQHMGYSGQYDPHLYPHPASPSQYYPYPPNHHYSYSQQQQQQQQPPPLPRQNFGPQDGPWQFHGIGPHGEPYMTDPRYPQFHPNQDPHQQPYHPTSMSPRPAVYPYGIAGNYPPVPLQQQQQQYAEGISQQQSQSQSQNQQQQRDTTRSESRSRVPRTPAPFSMVPPFPQAPVVPVETNPNPNPSTVTAAPVEGSGRRKRIGFTAPAIGLI